MNSIDKIERLLPKEIEKRSFEIIGEELEDDLVNKIFSEFCMGK